MSSSLTVLTKDQAAAVDRARSYHAACLKSFGDQIGYAFLAGRELAGLKDGQPHGTFMAFREAHFPEIPHRSATRYMDFHSKLATVANLTTAGNRALLTNGELPEKDREKVLAAVHEIADGKTLTALYRDLGVIKPAAPLGRREGEGGSKKLSLAEQAALLKEQAAKHWLDIDGLLSIYGPKFTVLKDCDVEAQMAVLERALTARKAWLKQPKNRRDPQAIDRLFT